MKGLTWTSLGSWTAQLVTWGSTLVVVHLLSPDDYGLVALATVYLGLVTMLSEFGIGTTVVTLRELSPRHVAELNTVAMLFALSAVAASLLLAHPISVFFVSPRLTQVIWIMSSALILGALHTVPTALLQQGLEFRYLATVQMIQSICAGVVTLAIALLGGGYWALAFGPLAGQAVTTVLVLLRRRPGYAWPEWVVLAPVLRFSRHVITERASWYGYTSADKLVIGRWLSESAVGLYSIASTFGLVAVEKVTVLMLRVAPAVFSMVQHDAAALRRYLLSMTEGLSIITFPICIGMALTAGDFVALVLGDQWMGAVAALQVLSVYGAFQSVSPLPHRVLVAIGETRFNMRLSIATLVVLPLVFIAGSRWGLVGVAAGWMVVPLVHSPMYFRLHRRIGLTASGYLGVALACRQLRPCHDRGSPPPGGRARAERAASRGGLPAQGPGRCLPLFRCSPGAAWPAGAAVPSAPQRAAASPG